MRAISFAITLVCIICAAHAEETKRLEQLKRNIISEKPETKVKKIDHERLVVRRLDIVDDDGTIRMVLASPTPPPIIDGVQYKRDFDASGLIIFDEQGSERGGFVIADIKGGAAVLAQDHTNSDAIGWRVMPDGSTSFSINQRPPITREPGLGNRITPSYQAVKRIGLSVAADGTPSIALADKQDRPRLRLTVNAEGFGAIEFLDAQGKVVADFVPERDRKQ